MAVNRRPISAVVPAVHPSVPAKTVARWRKTALAKEAAHHGLCAGYAIDVIVSRSKAGQHPATWPMFEADAYQHARAAGYWAALRIDADPLTNAQRTLLEDLQSVSRQAKDGWVEWWQVVNMWLGEHPIPLHLAPKTASDVWRVLESRGLVEAKPGSPDLVRPMKGRA